MSESSITVGLVIADTEEYIHVENAFSGVMKQSDICSLKGHLIELEGEYKSINLKTVCCGIGKVNAAVATTLLAKECDFLVNAGLSGGFDGVSKYDIVVGTEFVEHDFDLTAIGYKLSEKPGQCSRFVADKKLVDSVTELYPFVKTGLFVTGDSFISTADKHDVLAREFSPIACDMESAAFAYAAKLHNVPFISIRMISDGANDDSADSYSDTLKCDKADGWFNLTIDWIRHLR